MPNIRVPFQPSNFYHVYNHATGDESLFTEDRNYSYFLMLYGKYISPIASTFAFCLMPNHFHFVVRINDEKELKEYLNNLPIKDPKGFQKPLGSGNDHENPKGFGKPLGFKISHQFGNLQNAYTKAFNKVNSRRGQLFCQSVNRKELSSNDYIINAIRYVHFNPVSHNFTNHPADWRFSSFGAYMTNKNTQVSRAEGIALFNNKLSFIELHKHERGLEKYAVDMDLYY